MARGVVRAAFAVAFLLLVSGVEAHPFDKRFYSHQITLNVLRDQIGVDLVTEIPTPDVMQSFLLSLGGAEPTQESDKAFTATRLKELAAHLQLVVDGKDVPLTDVTPPDPKNGSGNSNFFTYHLTLTHPWAPAEGERHTLEVLNRNLTGGAAYYRNDVITGPGIALKTSSHWEAQTDPAVQATQGWSRDQAQRDLRVQVAIRAEGEPTSVAPEAPAAPSEPGARPTRAPWFLIGGGGALVAIAVLAGRRRRSRAD